MRHAITKVCLFCLVPALVGSGILIADEHAASQPMAAAESGTLLPVVESDALQPVAKAAQNAEGSIRPVYQLDVDLQPAQRRVSVRQQVRWTNPEETPVSSLVFQVTANNKLSKELITIGERTVESLRLDPLDCIDYQGRRFHLTSVSANGQTAHAAFSPKDDTHLFVQLSTPVEPGATVDVDLRFWIDIPPIMGRLGQHKGVTNLLNWYPVLTVYRNGEWHPVPYVPWHQPWYNEAGDYFVTLRIPNSHSAVTGGHVVSQSQLSDSVKELQIQGRGLRDFTIVTSDQFRQQSANVGDTRIRILHLPEHAEQAAVALKAAEESIQQYTEWFGPYPYREFEITESWFGWNGNESSGVIMIDSRILALPKYASRYVEHLVSHETCHQWWYSAVGTDGYHEPWMDEGLVSWFTRLRMEKAYGENIELLDLPGYGALQFPNVEYNNLVHSGFSMYSDRGGSGSALGSLDEMENLHRLFFLVYDRGARVTGMLIKRLGEDRFFEFMRIVYAKYQFRILKTDDFQRELESFTGYSWEPFFSQWLRGTGSADWQIDDVDIHETEDGSYHTEIRVSQQGSVHEPTDVEIRFGDTSPPIRLATASESSTLADGSATIRRVDDNDWLVTVVSQEEPRQVALDPDGVVVDSQPYNNVWRPETTVRFSPVYTPVDEASLMQPWQQHGVVGGLGVDGEGRIGLRASLAAGNRYRITPFVAYNAATAQRNSDYFSAGVDAVFYNFPSPNWQLRATYEHALLTTAANDPGQQARLALRRIFNYTTSVIYPDLTYVDIYTRFGDNFFPDDSTANSGNPAVEEYDSVRALGVDFHADSQMPYWDPDRGWRFDANYEHGFHALGGGTTYNRISGQFGVVQRLSKAPGWLATTKLAGRVSGGYGWSDNGEHFRFGGPGRFRGREATRTEGNAFWLSSLEWRYPIGGELNYPLLDNTAAISRVDGSLFYDVGRSYLMNDPQGKVDHAVGVGFYFQIPLLSFVENLTVRTEYGYSVSNDTGAFWFGLYRAF